MGTRELSKFIYNEETCARDHAIWLEQFEQFAILNEYDFTKPDDQHLIVALLIACASDKQMETMIHNCPFLQGLAKAWTIHINSSFYDWLTSYIPLYTIERLLSEISEISQRTK